MISEYKNFGVYPNDTAYNSREDLDQDFRSLDVSFSGLDIEEISECFERDSLRYPRDISLNVEGEVR